MYSKNFKVDDRKTNSLSVSLNLGGLGQSSRRELARRALSYLAHREAVLSFPGLEEYCLEPAWGLQWLRL